jgi:hypothetical protein
LWLTVFNFVKLLFSFSIVLLLECSTDGGLAVTGSLSLLTLGSLGDGLAGDGTLARFLVLTKSSSLSSE